MAAVTQPGAFHTAGSAHLEGIDLAGKTGTAQLMSHEALGKTNKGRSTLPNVWFVGVTPRRNPELVVAVLWQNGEFSYYPARLGARVVAAYVEKKRRLEKNLTPPKTPDDQWKWEPCGPRRLHDWQRRSEPCPAAGWALLRWQHRGPSWNSRQRLSQSPRTSPQHPTLAPSQLGAAVACSRSKQIEEGKLEQCAAS